MMLLIVTMGTFPFVVCLFTSGGRAWNNRALLFLKEHYFSFLASDSSHCSKLTNIHTYMQSVSRRIKKKYVYFVLQLKSNWSTSYSSFYIKKVHCFCNLFFFWWRNRYFFWLVVWCFMNTKLAALTRADTNHFSYNQCIAYWSFVN